MQVWSNANWNVHYPQAADRRRLTALATDRNATQKHAWRAEIVLLSADVVRHQRDHSEHQPEAIVGEHRGSGAVSFERSRIFEGDPPCIEKIEHFGFVLPVMQL
jgi:hypothetical protein